MAYTLDYADPVGSYLRGAALTRGERVRLFTSLHLQLAVVPDSFRNDPANRLSPDSPEFQWVLIMLADDGRLLVVRLIVDDSAASYGVLRVVYADCT